MPKLKLYLSSPWWPAAALSGAGFLCGFATALVFLLGAESDQIETLKRDLLQANARVETLQSAKQSINFALASVLPSPPPHSTELPAPNVLTQSPAGAPNGEHNDNGAGGHKATVTSGKVALVTVAPEPKSPPKPTPIKPAPPPPPKPKPAPPKSAAPKAAPVKQEKGKPAPPTKVEPTKKVDVQEGGGALHLPTPDQDATSSGSKAASVATASHGAVPVTDAEVKAAIATNSIEMSPKAKMGVDKIAPGAVVMSSGTTVRVGERFTSGERLLSVDKETGRIVTDKRTVVIMQ